jgi:hypothetical protein
MLKNYLIVGGVVVAGIILYALAQQAGFWIILGVLFVIIVFFVLRAQHRKEKALEALPLDGPMKVNITEDLESSGRYKCALRINVVISRKDRATIEQAGLEDYLIFEYPGASGPIEPDNVRQFRVKDLNLGGTYIGFLSVPQMQEAKEKLIQSLHILREQIDSHRAGPKKESFEI